MNCIYIIFTFVQFSFLSADYKNKYNVKFLNIFKTVIDKYIATVILQKITLEYCKITVSKMF